MNTKRREAKRARRAARKARKSRNRTVIVKDTRCRKIPGSEFRTPEGLDAYRCDDPQHTHHTVRSVSGDALAELLSMTEESLLHSESQPASLRDLFESQGDSGDAPMVGDEDLVRLWSKASDEERRAYCAKLVLRVRDCPDAPFSLTVRKLHREMAEYGAELTWEACPGMPGLCSHRPGLGLVLG